MRLKLTSDLSSHHAKNIYLPEYLSYAPFFRSLALKIDRDPSEIQPFVDHPSFQVVINDRQSPCLERTKIFEALAYGDAGVLLSAPGPSLSGQMINEIGNEAQKAFYFDYVRNKKCRTFLAVTEPKAGSDVANIKTCIQPANTSDHFYLTGEKCFIGNGATGEIGVVIAKKSQGPLGISAVLIVPGTKGVDLNENTHIKRHVIPTVGLRGASLSHIVFDHYEINHAQILGEHLRVINRGMMALVKTFNRMRTCVGALALGTAQAALDYVCEHKQTLNNQDFESLQRCYVDLMVARILLYSAAVKVDRDPEDAGTASLAKAVATQMAEKIVIAAIGFFDQSVFFEHPLLEKWYRDVYGYEYMEGTSHIHYKNVSKNMSVDTDQVMGDLL